MPTYWSFRERTDQVHRLLRDLSQDLLLWGQFFDDPLRVAQDYGLSVPEGIIQGNLHVRKRPSAQLFSSKLDWVAFDDKCLSYDPDAPNSVESLSGTRPSMATEIILTLSRAKPSTRLSMQEESLGLAIQFLTDQTAPFVLSPFKVIVDVDGNKGGYSNIATKIVPFDTADKGLFHLYVSLDGAQAQAAVLLDVLKADCELGRALGYPECCVQFFVENFPKAVGTHRGDLVLFSLRNTIQHFPYSFYLNNLARYFGIHLISHFPCHYACAASVSLGKQYFEVLQNAAPKLAERTKELLLCPVVYSDSEGVFLLEEFSSLPDGRLAYNPDRIRATDETTSLYRLLCTADRIETTAGDGGRVFLYRGDRPVGQADSNARCVTFTGDAEEFHQPGACRSECVSS